MDLFVRLLKFATRYRSGIIFAIALVFVTTGLGMVPPYMTRLLVDSQLSNYHMLSPAEQISVQDDLWALVLAVCAGLLGVRLSVAIVSYVRSMIMVVIGNRVVFDIRQQLYRHLQRLSMRYFETHSTGRVMTRILYDVGAIQQTLTGNLVDIITNSTTVLFVFVLVFAISWRRTRRAGRPPATSELPPLAAAIRRVAEAASSLAVSGRSTMPSGIRVIKAHSRA